MNVLIVFAHPEPASFSGALKDVAVQTLSALGHDVAVSDLYGLGWNPALGPDDFPGVRADAGYLTGYADRLRTLESAEPLFFHPWRDYDETQRLKPGVAARSGVQWNPRAGQSFELSAQDFKDGGAPPSKL